MFGIEVRVAPDAALERKASATSRVILAGLGLGGVPVPKPDYRALARASYMRNVSVYALVAKIARAIAVVPWIMTELPRAKGSRPKRIVTRAAAKKALAYGGPNRFLVRKALEATAIEEHEALTLIEKPNPDDGSQARYFEKLASYLLLAGNGYEEIVGEDRPLEIWALRPDRVDIVPRAAMAAGAHTRRDGTTKKFTLDERREAEAIDGLVGRFEYSVGGAKQDFAPAQIIHHKFFNPDDDFYGLAPALVAARAWQTDNLAQDWNYALLKNEGRPSGALIAPQPVDDPTYERVKAEIKAAVSGGSVGEPLFLEGGLEWVQFGLSPKDLDWSKGTSETLVRLCAAFMTPPEIMGSQEHRTYNSMPEARRAWWMEANLPLLSAIRDAWNARIVPAFGERLHLDFDRDQIDALQDDRNVVWGRVRAADAISFNEKREALGYERIEGDPDLDVPVGMLQKAVPAPTAGAPAGEDKGQPLSADQIAARARLEARTAASFEALGEGLATLLEAAR